MNECTKEFLRGWWRLTWQSWELGAIKETYRGRGWKNNHGSKKDRRKRSTTTDTARCLLLRFKNVLQSLKHELWAAVCLLKEMCRGVLWSTQKFREFSIIKSHYLISDDMVAEKLVVWAVHRYTRYTEWAGIYRRFTIQQTNPAQ